MYYILAEATYDQDKEKAMRYFNDVRNSRGLNDYASAEVTSREEFMELVLAERYKEFWGGKLSFLTNGKIKGLNTRILGIIMERYIPLRLKCLYCLGRKKNWNLVELIKTDRYEKEYIISDFYLTGNFNSGM
mgnify:CR=1 FL=1